MKFSFKVFTTILALLLLVYAFGPQPQTPSYKPQLPNTPAIGKLDAYVSEIEKKHKIKPGNNAEIIWANSSKQQTEYAVVYLHGFSSSKEEGNPVHKNMASAIKANLYLARLADHGLDTTAAMENFTADRLWESAKQAYAIGAKLGKKVILVGTSTGGTLALLLAAKYPQIHALILLSPNIEINDSKAWLLNNPWGLQIARLVTNSNDRIVTRKTPVYKQYWYTNYRLESVVQLQELLESSMKASLFEKVKQPTLMLYYYKNEKEQDKVVKVSAMLRMFEKLGTSVDKKEKIALPNTENHVVASYITSKDLRSVEQAIKNFTAKHLR